MASSELTISLNLDESLATINLVVGLTELSCDAGGFIPAVEVSGLIDRWHAEMAETHKSGVGALVETLKRQRDELRRLRDAK